MQIRARRRMEDLAINLQEGIAARRESRQQHERIYRHRMTDSLKQVPQVQDWTGSMGMSPSGRFQIVEDGKAKRKLWNAEGIRWDAAVIALVAAVGLGLAFVLADIANAGASMSSISYLEQKIESIREKNEEIRQQVAMGSGDISVCTEAVKLNLISGNGAQTIVLTAPQQDSQMSAPLYRKDKTGRVNASVGD